MIEHERGDDSDSDSERLIPEIPGVIGGQDVETWGDLTEDPEEESQENLIKEINKEVRSLLTTFGVEGLHGVPQEEIGRLWERMDMDTFLVADLVLLTSIESRRLYRDDFRQPKFRDLKERSELSENPYDVRLKIIEEVAPNLLKLGYGRLKSYRLTRHQDENLAFAFKAQGWLTGLSFMSELPAVLNSQRAAAPDRRLSPAKVFGITREEILRQGRHAQSTEVKALYDFRLTSHQEAYDLYLKSIRNAFKVAEAAFSRYLVK
jgi:hypothetical protein